MFDIGFWELCMVGLVTLLVIGPERLPKAARIAGYWLGKTRALVSSVKEEIRQELREEELRQMLKDQPELEEFKQLNRELSNAAHSINSSSIEKPQEKTDRHGGE